MCSIQMVIWFIWVQTFADGDILLGSENKTRTSDCVFIEFYASLFLTPCCQVHASTCLWRVRCTFVRHPWKLQHPLWGATSQFQRSFRNVHTAVDSVTSDRWYRTWAEWSLVCYGRLRCCERYRHWPSHNVVFHMLGGQRWTLIT